MLIGWLVGLFLCWFDDLLFRCFVLSFVGCLLVGLLICVFVSWLVCFVVNVLC